jgi:hypothetical protein
MVAFQILDLLAMRADAFDYLKGEDLCQTYFFSLTSDFDR